MTAQDAPHLRLPVDAGREFSPQINEEDFFSVFHHTTISNKFQDIIL